MSGTEKPLPPGALQLLQNFQSRNTRPPKYTALPPREGNPGMRERALNIHFTLQNYIKGCQKPSRVPITTVLPEEIEGVVLDLAIAALLNKRKQKSDFGTNNANKDEKIDMQNGDDTSMKDMYEEETDERQLFFVERQAYKVTASVLRRLNLDNPIPYSTPPTDVESYSNSENFTPRGITSSKPNIQPETEPQPPSSTIENPLPPPPALTLKQGPKPNNPFAAAFAKAHAKKAAPITTTSTTDAASSNTDTNTNANASANTNMNTNTTSDVTNNTTTATTSTTSESGTSPIPSLKRLSSFRNGSNAEDDTPSNRDRTFTVEELRGLVRETLSSPTSLSSPPLAKKRPLTQNDSNDSTQSNSPLPHYRIQVEGASLKGLRAENDDRIRVVLTLEALVGKSETPSSSSTTPTNNNNVTGRKHCFIGLYDGHLGPQAADYVRTHLHVNLLRDPRFTVDTEAALRGAFLKTDRDLNAKSKEMYVRLQQESSGNRLVTSGTTATSLLFRDDGRIVLGHTGDSAAVLARKGASAVRLSACHRPDSADEKKRIEAAGGAVVFYGCWRVNGVLGVSRSIGDGPLAHLVVAEPEIKKFWAQEDDEFVIVGSDGLWDVMNEQESVDFVRDRLYNRKGYEVKHNKICIELCEEALKRGGTDNISVIIAFFGFDNSSPDDL